MLPAIFSGPLDALPAYQLATLCRLNYRNLPDAWDMVSRGLRKHLTRTELAMGGMFPKVTTIQLTDHQVVIINGSSNLNDWIQHTRAAVTTLIPSTAERVGIQYYDAAVAIRDALLGLGDGFYHLKPMVLVGHSYGGAIANVLARLLKLNDPTHVGQRVVMSFGCPRVGDANFDAQRDWPHWRCMHGVDFVTQIPVTGWVLPDTILSLGPTPLSYVHGGRIYYAAPGGPFAYGVARDWPARTLYDSGIFDSGMVNFERQTFTQLEAISHHAIWQYTLAWRRAVREAERYSLEAFDRVNDMINTDTGDSWPDVTIKLDGFSTEKRRLPDDPPDGPELLPFPQPALPPSSFVPVPPVEWQMQEMARRRRRTI